MECTVCIAIWLIGAGLACLWMRGATKKGKELYDD